LLGKCAKTSLQQCIISKLSGGNPYLRGRAEGERKRGHKEKEEEEGGGQNRREFCFIAVGEMDAPAGWHPPNVIYDFLLQLRRVFS